MPEFRNTKGFSFSHMSVGYKHSKIQWRGGGDQYLQKLEACSVKSINLICITNHFLVFHTLTAASLIPLIKHVYNVACSWE